MFESKTALDPDMTAQEYLTKYKKELTEYAESKVEAYRLIAERAERERDVATSRFIDEAKRNAEMAVELRRLSET